MSDSAPPSPKSVYVPSDQTRHRRQWSFPLSATEHDEPDRQHKILMIRTENRFKHGNNLFYEMDKNKMLGRGHQSVVFAGRARPFAIEKVPPWDKAIKVIRVSHRIAWRLAFRNECCIFDELQQMDDPHPNIVRCVDYGIVSHHHAVIVMERLEGMTLSKRLENHGSLSDSESLYVMEQLSSAVHYLHQRCKISVRDIKPDNIIVDSDMQVKLVDFGLAIHAPEAYQRTTSIVTGTWFYMAPEVLHEQVHDIFLSDMWSLGQVLFQMKHGLPMFVDCQDVDELKRENDVRQGGLDEVDMDAFDADTPAGVKYYEILCGLCEPNPAKRWDSLRLISVFPLLVV